MLQMQGVLLRYLLKGRLYLANNETTAFSLSPTYMENSSEPFTARKFSPDSLATARASSVLLQPGGPYNSTPLGA